MDTNTADSGSTEGFGLQVRRMRGLDQASADALLRAEILQTGCSRLSLKGIDSAVTTLARLRHYMIARVSARSIDALWPRDRLASKYRCMYVFINRGDITVTGSTTSHVDTGVCVVRPGSTAVGLSATEAFDVLVFSFDYRDAGLTDADFRSPSIEAHRRSPRSPTSTVRENTLHGPFFLFLAALLDTTPDHDEDTVGPTVQILRSIAHTLTSQDFPQNEDPLIGALVDVVERRLGEPHLTVGEIARELGVTRRTLERVCSSAGVTVGALLMRARATRAKEMLVGASDLSMAEIAESAGFGSVDSMRYAMKRLYGSTPSRIRNEC
ncbi:AraC family transcriptional regulator [Microbacterium sp. No. 7]|uniref:AraC family transcriptional regulator n=1 Tax=Microbacterium sp. No. 7 TaxID=1714373 RepID=UPI0006ED26A5|nr:helix-turn-helix domain-containing protein [Microbacterium sp. No. 7]ALJ19848.1 hypothetical protein AOA12_07985 [Microbacterium sp. No. 7]